MWLGCTTHIISVLAHAPLFISTYLSQLVHLQLEFTPYGLSTGFIFLQEFMAILQIKWVNHC